MNDFYNAVTVHVESGNVAGTIDALEKWRLEHEKPEITPVDPEVDVEVVEVVKISYITRGVDKPIIAQLDEALNKAGIVKHCLDWEMVDISEANLAVDETKDIINACLSAAGFLNSKFKVGGRLSEYITDKCSHEQLTAICMVERELRIAEQCARFDQWAQFHGAISVVEHMLAKAFPTQFPNFVTKLANNERAA
jgi:hypothetical protein